jgi:hypothetical protein
MEMQTWWAVARGLGFVLKATQESKDFKQKEGLTRLDMAEGPGVRVGRPAERHTGTSQVLLQLWLECPDHLSV